MNSLTEDFDDYVKQWNRMNMLRLSLVNKHPPGEVAEKCRAALNVTDARPSILDLLMYLPMEAVSCAFDEILISAADFSRDQARSQDLIRQFDEALLVKNLNQWYTRNQFAVDLENLRLILDFLSEINRSVAVGFAKKFEQHPSSEIVRLVSEYS